MTDDTRKDSEYRKAQRFFEKFAMPLHDIGCFVLSQIPKPKKGWTLAMDRTNWKFGKTHINILTVGVVHQGMAIPIAWKVLPQRTKRGNSNTDQRIEIIKSVLKLMPANSIYALTMDREFIGARWLKCLDDEGIGFIVRMKKITSSMASPLNYLGDLETVIHLMRLSYGAWNYFSELNLSREVGIHISM